MVSLIKRGAVEELHPAAEMLARNLRKHRRAQGLTLEVLAARSGVSRAMISKIERNSAIPTATVLGKLAAGLKLGLSQLVGSQQPREATLVERKQQAIFRDPASGLVRRSLSPLFPDRAVDFVHNTLPAGRHVTFPAHHAGVEEYLFVNRGRLVVILNGKRHHLIQGSSIFYPANVVHEFVNNTKDTTEFFIVVDNIAAR